MASQLACALMQMPCSLRYGRYLLAQRYTIWGWVAGIPHERLIGYHRIHAWAFYAMIFAHMVCMAVAMRTRIDGFPITRQISDRMDVFKVNPQLGIAAFILWSHLMFSSFDKFRRMAWGMWYLNHVRASATMLAGSALTQPFPQFTFFPAVMLTLFHNRCVCAGTWTFGCSC